MPIQTEETQTPKGHLCMRARVSGHVSLADAQNMGAQLQPGQRFHQGRVLSIVEKGTDYSPDARKYFPTLNGNYARLAVVVTNALLRATINFLTRLSITPDFFRLFSTEAEAMAWLDQE